MTFTPRPLIVPPVIYFVFSSVAAVLEKRSDALGAWETWLRIDFGILLPCFCLVFARYLGRFETDSTDFDAARVRFGANRRRVVLERFFVLVALGLLVQVLVLGLGRITTYPAFSTCFNRDLWICIGIGALATITYISGFCALSKFGVSYAPAYIGFFVDLTLGHADAWLSLLTPHRHIAQLLGTANHFYTSALASSLVLLGFSVVSTAWILARTPR